MKVCSVNNCNEPARARGWCNRHYLRWKNYGHPEAKPRTASDGEPMAWLLAHVNHIGEECLRWPFGTSKGYAIVVVEGRTQTAARIMCQLRFGTPPSERHEAAHSCGQGHNACINPQHVRWATPEENQADRLMHGTSNRGTANGSNILTIDQVVEIYRRLCAGEHHKDIAMDFGVTGDAVRNIKRGRTWAWLTGVTR